MGRPKTVTLPQQSVDWVVIYFRFLGVLSNAEFDIELGIRTGKAGKVLSLQGAKLFSLTLKDNNRQLSKTHGGSIHLGGMNSQPAPQTMEKPYGEL